MTQRITDVRLSELLDHATEYGKYDETNCDIELRRDHILVFKELRERRETVLSGETTGGGIASTRVRKVSKPLIILGWLLWIVFVMPGAFIMWWRYMFGEPKSLTEAYQNAQRFHYSNTAAKVLFTLTIYAVVAFLLLRNNGAHQ